MRLWPKSRKAIPKQFMTLRSQPTLFQQALDRAQAYGSADIYVVVPPPYKELVKQQAPGLTNRQIIVEPVQHSTTASLGYALLSIQAQGLLADDVVALIPSDAYVQPMERFLDCLRQAVEVAAHSNGVVTIGAKPYHPATGYGYIRIGAPFLGASFKVERFIEKPTYERACRYVQSETYYWNAGIFVFKASTIWSLFEHQLPDVFKQLEEKKRLDLLTPSEHLDWYTQLPNQSFEFSLIERAPEIYMVPAEFEWADLGTWSALMEKTATLDPNSAPPVVMLDSNGCLVESDEGLVALLGVQDLIVIKSNDVVLVCQRDREQDVKQLLVEIERRGTDKYL